LNTDHGLKAASWTLETKMVKYIIASKLNVTFGMIGNAMADKMTAKVIGRNSELLLWREELT